MCQRNPARSCRVPSALIHCSAHAVQYILKWDNPKVGLITVLHFGLEHMTRSLHSVRYAKFLSVLVATRRARNLTQQVVADRLQKPQSYVAKVEGGERRLDIVEFTALARAFGVDPTTLFADALAAMEGADS